MFQDPATMPHDPFAIESDLRQLRAAALDDRLLARLEACAANTWTELNPEEIRFEHRLLASAPAKLPPALLTSLEATLRDVAFPGAAKIVHFPQPQTTAPRHHRAWWSAAAVVALAGALTALLVPTHHHSSGKLASAPPETHTTLPARNAQELIPADFNRDLTEARDQGIIWQSNNQPHHVLKVEYIDWMTLKDAAGHTYQVKQPSVEYILLPVKPD